MALVVAAAAVPPAEECSFDSATSLVLDETAFDQDSDGWRALARPGCFLVAADLIAAYRARHPGHGAMLYFHEAQMRAAGNDYAAAAPLFEASRSGENEWRVDTGWNDYVAASAAFVRRDLRTLKAHRERLSRLPPPPLQPQVADAARAEPIPEGWPYNLDVMDRLIACFDEPYAEAMAGCRT